MSWNAGAVGLGNFDGDAPFDIQQSLATGKGVDSVSLEEPPHRIERMNGRVFVRCYSSWSVVRFRA